MKCCICGNELKHPRIPDYFGNNPFPVRAGENDRCCDECNGKYVIPFRIMMMKYPPDDDQDIVDALSTCTQTQLDKLLNY